ncbi:amino acid adenylation domain-containing protein [Rhodopirellula sp. P2]|uniref:amino acid adenylation domain-containing protein n=1 Tax=Rhodopirellula sp. P2 TaxID=2127060 RepID=UPI002368F160|nr:amino acid adenylation domain-containing protein [Rhodopirellula sp. P2]WDQ18674.1 amino acid adenylation domain-containing protein [Rhodopirellula sp. P2]
MQVKWFDFGQDSLSTEPHDLGRFIGGDVVMPNNTPIKTTPAFIDLFWRQCDAAPDRMAVVHEETSWTYQELLDQSCHIAQTLGREGVLPGDRVGMCLDRTPIAIASMLGIHLAGAAFVPLDPDYPADRLRYMLDDAQINTLIGHGKYRGLFEDKKHTDHESTASASNLNWIEASDLIRKHVPASSLARADHPTLQGDQLAYVMYTSGSTGTPKGVLINHAALTTYCRADMDVYRLHPDDRTLQFSTLTFDIAIEEIFPPLLCGSCVVIRPLERADSVNELSHLIETQRITAVHLATAYWHQWVDLMLATGSRVPPSLRLMVVTGEKVSVDHYHRWQTICDHDVLWCNAYGPTEATVTATVFFPKADFSDTNMPIGKPLPGYSAVILDSDLAEVPVGETGQLFLGGPALADGYLNQPELTAAAFIHRKNADGEVQRWYRTGDISRWLDDGNIDFGGRVDHQIKLGSYRIEPGEIEAALTSIADVHEALVTAEAVDGQTTLLAYIGMGPDTLSSNGTPSILPNELPTIASRLAQKLREKLPPYMVPKRYVFAEVFPKTINGKIDRTGLPSGDQAVIARDESAVAPRTELQKQLCDIWSSVLQIPQIGIEDDFFLLGGSSLLVTQVVARLKDQLGLELPVRDFFANPTIELASHHIEAMLGQRSGGSPATAVQSQRERLPEVEAFFLPSGSHELFAVHYTPPKRQARKDRAVVLCHAYGHEYARSYRNLQQLAVHLAQQGFDVLRFDYAGTGNSHGNALEATPHVMMKNIRDASRWMRQRHDLDAISLIGIRLGATLAACSETSHVEQLLLWDPIASGEEFLQHLDHLHAMTLSNGTRFSKPRRPGSIDQAYGTRLNHVVRQQLNQLKWTPDELRSDCVTSLLCSRDYHSTERNDLSPNSDVPVIQLDDEIGWDRPELTESAFSSPGAIQHITRLLQNESNVHPAIEVKS